MQSDRRYTDWRFGHVDRSVHIIRQSFRLAFHGPACAQLSHFLFFKPSVACGKKRDENNNNAKVELSRASTTHPSLRLTLISWLLEDWVKHISKMTHESSTSAASPSARRPQQHNLLNQGQHHQHGSAVRSVWPHIPRVVRRHPSRLIQGIRFLNCKFCLPFRLWHI